MTKKKDLQTPLAKQRKSQTLFQEQVIVTSTLTKIATVVNQPQSMTHIVLLICTNALFVIPELQCAPVVSQIALKLIHSVSVWPMTHVYIKVSIHFSHLMDFKDKLIRS